MRNRIREVRKMKKITQAKLVENISITRQYISLIELGEETPSLKVANEIATALGICMYAIFDLDGTGEYRCSSCNCSQ
ncbi:TPA: helix-turn-helix domain-containing protein [Streptococcus equi subsp. zooepidemicus]|uniref:Transcriptional regulator n=1 Tax=Streptococcus equi subsp. zooepidemicus Sz4is TaxID=1381082 RepID=A0AAW3GJS1_STRSZ|nr:transcriptional regulator [Streptococcus equi subsp. zooepidemicus Sz4is]HEL0010509.1 helix-turn-helix domain-containing protein [Streptococcus equi subsp. zooepidemicus]HEL0012581.1 helix-turn-helix domain-containing protein [Streptococcus equi subsp. zooepidemicus]HEL0014645.1 helix-turn-helix domain-containing protein [Streptococcus equi subsp. zooepidemicus]HEL0018760.1 helix-turn-helix domain-containing protein [Streptococcus equi subsp. zooepidemicus]